MKTVFANRWYDFMPCTLHHHDRDSLNNLRLHPRTQKENELWSLIKLTVSLKWSSRSHSYSNRRAFEMADLAFKDVLHQVLYFFPWWSDLEVVLESRIYQKVKLNFIIFIQHGLHFWSCLLKFWCIKQSWVGTFWIWPIVVVHVRHEYIALTNQTLEKQHGWLEKHKKALICLRSILVATFKTKYVWQSDSKQQIKCTPSLVTAS